MAELPLFIFPWQVICGCPIFPSPAIYMFLQSNPYIIPATYPTLSTLLCFDEIEKCVAKLKNHIKKIMYVCMYVTYLHVTSLVHIILSIIKWNNTNIRYNIYILKCVFKMDEFIRWKHKCHCHTKHRKKIKLIILCIFLHYRRNDSGIVGQNVCVWEGERDYPFLLYKSSNIEFDVWLKNINLYFKSKINCQICNQLLYC